MTSAVLFDNVTAGYSRHVPTLHEVSFNVESGDSLAIVGESGAGKTTIARLVTGLLLPQQGAVRVFDRDWRHGTEGDFRRSVQMVFQDPYGSLNPKLTALDTVADVVQRWERCSRATARGKAQEQLGDVGLGPDLAMRRPHRLSGGQCQRVGIARALAARAELIVADEPTSALDVSVQLQVLDLLTNLVAQRSVTLVIITHDLGVANRTARRCLVLKAGQVVEVGVTASVLGNPKAEYTRELIAAIPGGRHDGRAQRLEI